jgi:hypothetical protein
LVVPLSAIAGWLLGDRFVRIVETGALGRLYGGRKNACSGMRHWSSRRSVSVSI